jgi:hypothetical protein
LRQDNVRAYNPLYLDIRSPTPVSSLLASVQSLQTGDNPGRLQMPAVTISEAAQALGFKSRSTLYRLRDDGHLANYLRPGGPTGRQLLELAPAGLPPLREHVARFVRAQANNSERQRASRIDPRWQEVAGALTEALAERGALQLCGHEAKAIAEVLPDALLAFGWEQLEALRVKMSDMGLYWAGPGTAWPLAPDKIMGHWREWGRWEPGIALGDDGEDFWENIGKIAGSMLGGKYSDMNGDTACDLYHQIVEAAEDVMAGARWDQRNWDNADARTVLEDPDIVAGNCLGSCEDLQKLLDRGLLTAEHQSLAREAIANCQANKQEAAALPVVLS